MFNHFGWASRGRRHSLNRVGQKVSEGKPRERAREHDEFEMMWMKGNEKHEFSEG